MEHKGMKNILIRWEDGDDNSPTFYINGIKVGILADFKLNWSTEIVHLDRYIVIGDTTYQISGRSELEPVFSKLPATDSFHMEK